MSKKTQLYENPSYVLSVGNDVIFLDIKLLITQENEKDGVYSAEVRQCQLNPNEESALIKALQFMNSEGLQKFYAFLSESLLAETKDSLFSLFYSGT